MSSDNNTDILFSMNVWDSQRNGEIFGERLVDNVMLKIMSEW
ncbi:20301_t:CDS:1, partial [Dentiscutata erythropus]